MGTLQYSTSNYIMITYISFTYLIPGDVLPGNSKAIGIICALWNCSYPDYTPEMKTTTTTTEKNWSGNETTLCSLKSSSLKTGKKNKHINALSSLDNVSAHITTIIPSSVSLPPLLPMLLSQTSPSSSPSL